MIDPRTSQDEPAHWRAKWGVNLDMTAGIGRNRRVRHAESQGVRRPG
jgi:hypothetical protein